MSRRRSANAIALGGCVLTLTVFVVGACTPDYSQSADTVSLLASPGQPLANVVRAAIILYGISIIAATCAIGDVVRAPRLARGLVAAYGAAAVFAGLVAKDASDAHAAASQLHVAATIVGGAALIGAMATAALTSDSARVRALSGWSVALSVAGTAAFRLLWGSPFYGLIEKALIALATLWCAGCATRAAQPTCVGRSCVSAA